MADELHRRIDPTPCEARAALAAKVRERLPGRQGGWLSAVIHASGAFADKCAETTIKRSSPADTFLPESHDLVTTAWTAVLDAPSVEGISREVVAARLAYAALFVRQRIADGELAADEADNGLETSSYGFFFSTALVPSRRAQLRRRSGDLTHIAVLVRGRCFRIEVVDSRGECLELQDLVGAIRACVVAAAAATPGPCVATSATVGALTRLYESACTEEMNFASFAVMNAAMFVICLDDDAPASTYDTGCAAQVGQPDNRWFMHGLQFVVFANGRAAVIGSFFAGLAGSQAVRFLDAMHEELKTVPIPSLRTGHESGRARALNWQIAPDDLRTVTTHTRPRRRAPESVFSVAFGRNHAKSLGVSPALAFHLAAQAAVRLQRGTFPAGPAFQLVNMRHVEGGSLAEHDTVSAATRQWAEAVAAGAPASTLRRHLLAAADEYDAALHAVRNGFTLTSVMTAVPRLFRRALDRSLTRNEWARWSLLPPPSGVALLGRFGVTFTVPTSTAGHAFVGATTTQVIVIQGPSPVIRLQGLAAAMNQAAGALRSMTDAPSAEVRTA